MQAVEFQTTIQNGTIEIPLELRNHVGTHVKVILLATERRPRAANAIEELMSRPASVPDFRPLTREEAHAR